MVANYFSQEKGKAAYLIVVSHPRQFGKVLCFALTAKCYKFNLYLFRSIISVSWIKFN